MAHNDNPHCQHPDDCRRHKTGHLYCFDCSERAAGHFKWTDEAVAFLGELNSEGRTSSSIAIAMGDRFGLHFSRNMIIGKMKRLGMATGNPVGVRKAVKRSRPTLHLVEKTIRPPRQAKIISNIIRWDGLAKVRFLDRKPNQCAWIVGEPKGEETMCCGDPATHSWCDFHYEIAHERTVAKRSLIEFVHDELTIAQMHFARTPTGKSSHWKRQLNSLRGIANRSKESPPANASPAGGDRGICPDPPPPGTICMEPDGAE